MLIGNMYKHFITITTHRHVVCKLCFKCGLYYQGLTHDLSKYSPTEFINSAKYYLGYRSPIGQERRTLGYSKIFLHHKGRNKHHFEYWYDPYATNRRISMPLNYIVESICDRIAASKVYLKDQYTTDAPLNYFYKDVNVTNYMNPDEHEYFENYLIYLKENGEAALLEKMHQDIIEFKKSKNNQHQSAKK